MKKETLFFSLILGLGLFFEYLHLTTTSTLLGIKSYLLGAVCILVGLLGLWIYTIMPFFNRKENNS